MKRIAATVLALALAASGSAFANHTPSGYGHDARYGDTRYGDQYGYGNDRYGRNRYDMAQVISVDPIFARNDYRRDRRYDDRDCRDGRYDRDYRYNDRYGYSSPRTNGAALGAIVGGALGNQAGKGDGRKAATIAGAVIGGVIGAEVADNNRHDQPRVMSQRNGYGCDGYGYDDRYRYNDRYDNDRYGNDRYGNGYGDRYGSGYGYDDRVIGYNVTYRYAGRNYRTRMDHHPGRTIRVRVDVRPDGRRIAMGL